jgi:hypothetical protein
MNFIYDIGFSGRDAMRPFPSRLPLIFNMS